MTWASCWGDSNPNILTNLDGFFHGLKMTWASVEVILTLIFTPIEVDFDIVKNYLGKCWGDSNPNILANLGGLFHC